FSIRAQPSRADLVAIAPTYYRSGATRGAAVERRVGEPADTKADHGGGYRVFSRSAVEVRRKSTRHRDRFVGGVLDVLHGSVSRVPDGLLGLLLEVLRRHFIGERLHVLAHSLPRLRSLGSQ